MITVRKMIGGMCLAVFAATMWTGAATAPALAEETPVSIRFSWKLKGEYAPHYVALDKGYFLDEGLKVTMGEGAGAQAALAAVEQGQETATFAPAAFALQAISKGLDVKIVGLYHPATPLGFLSHPEKPIRVPKDLEGKSMVVSVGDTVGDFLGVFCQINDVDCTKIERIQTNIPARLSTFISKQADTMGTYNHIDVPTLHSKGQTELILMDATKFGLILPGGSLIVSNKQIAENPKILGGLLRGLARGYEYTKANPEEAARILMKYWETTLGEEVVAEQVRQTVAAVPEYPGHPIGWIDETTFGKSLQQIKDAGKIEEIRSLDTYYTNSLHMN